MLPRLISLIIVLIFSLPVAHALSFDEGYKLYQDVLSGRKEIESLSPDELQMVLQINNAVNRSSCDGCSDSCRDAKEIAESYRNDLESYASRLRNCAGNSDLTDDCYSEFRRVKSAHSDFESAVSEVNSYCN